MRRRLNGKEKSSVCLAPQIPARIPAHKGGENGYTGNLTLSLRSIWLPSLEMSTVSEHRHYAWITYTPINDAHGILHTI